MALEQMGPRTLTVRAIGIAFGPGTLLALARWAVAWVSTIAESTRVPRTLELV